MKFKVPSSWDKQLLEGLSEINNSGGSICEIFGSLQKSMTGTSRSIFEEECRSRKQLEDYVEEIHSHGFKFNYIINSTSLGNIEYDLNRRNELMDYLSWVSKNSDAVTVAMPYLAELIMDEFSMPVVASTMACVNSVKSAVAWDEMGVSRIVLDYSVNRNFKLIKSIRDAVNCDIELILNDGCLLNCPYRQFHANAVSHSSQGKFWLPYEVLKCSMRRASDASEYIKTPWIRPEDLKAYEDIGISHFKLSGRGKSTEFILNCAKAYSKGKYDGNLADLITLVTVSSHAIGELVVNEKIDVFIDNKKLDNFLEHFKKQECLSCKTCNYCENVARDAVKISGNVDAYRKELENFLPLMLHFEKDKYKNKYMMMRAASDTYSKGKIPSPVFKFLLKLLKPISPRIVKRMNE